MFTSSPSHIGSCARPTPQPGSPPLNRGSRSHWEVPCHGDISSRPTGPDQRGTSDSPTAWTLWQKTIHWSFCISNSQRLQSALGNWHSHDPNWGSFFHQSSNHLYVISDGQWSRFALNNQRFTGPTTRYVYIDNAPPPGPTSHTAVAWVEGNELVSHGIGKLSPKTSDQPVTPWFF